MSIAGVTGERKIMYQKQNFVKGQKLKAEEMNHIEDGIVAVEKSVKDLEELASAGGIHIGPDAPVAGEQKVWIDTDEGSPDVDDPEEESKPGIDVIAKPGQVIAVKTVGEDSKPTRFKAVDLPKAETPDWNANEGEKGYIEGRTHYVDAKGIVHKLDNKFIDAEWMATKQDGGAGKTVFIPEQTVSNNAWSGLQGSLVEGTVYAVEVNGILYRCVCRNDGDGTLYLGNGSLLGDTSTPHNNEPFCIGWLTGTGGAFYKDGTLEAPIGIKVTNWLDVVYNKLPEEYLPDNVVKGEGGKVGWDNVSGKPFIEGAGEPFFEHTATFATDAAARNGVQVTGASVTAMLDTVYWLEINGDLLKCHWKRDGFSSVLCDEDGNEWASYGLGGVYVCAQTAGTYTYKLYAPTEEPMLEPQYIPPHLARKYDIPDVSGMVKSVNGTTPDKNGNVVVEIPESTGGGVDVTASVGQTIIVEEVDASGKPTKWRAADYQPRTHWSAFTDELVPTTEVSDFNTENFGVPMATMPAIKLEVGRTYKVIFDGLEYVCVADVASLGSYTAVAIGNTVLSGGEDTGEPFAIAYVESSPYSFVFAMDMNPHTVQVFAEVAIPIPAQYVTNALPYYIEATGKWVSNTSSEYSTNETVAALTAVLQTGRDIILRVNEEMDMNGTRNTMFYRLATMAQDNSGMLAFYSSVGVGLILTPTTDGTYSISALGLGANL